MELPASGPSRGVRGSGRSPVRPRVGAALVGLLAFLGACAPQSGPWFLEAYLKHPHRTLTDYVRLLEGKPNRERRETLERILRAKGIKYKAERYSSGGEAGVNLLFELGTGNPELIVSAHHDAVPGSPGANDDASCIASILKAHERLRTESLQALKVRFVIFDEEESGLKGSAAHVRTHPLKSVVAMYSLELCGIGDTVALWDVQEKDKARPGVRALTDTLKEMGVPHVVEGKIPRFGSDHKKFAEAGVPALALTAVPQRDEALLREYVFRPHLPKWAERKNRPAIFRTYHTPDDTADTLQEGAMRLMADVISRIVLNLNRRLGSLTAP